MREGTVHPRQRPFSLQILVHARVMQDADVQMNRMGCHVRWKAIGPDHAT